MKENSNIIVYRVKDKGLEVLLVKGEGEQWDLPQSPNSESNVIGLNAGEEQIITLDPVEGEVDGIFEQAYAVEADWHDIPSLKSILKHDVRFMKDTVKKMIPDMMERGAFVAVKDAFKRVLPNKYKMLKELKDILTDRNSTKYM
ncbi:MAG: hypothetical protein AAF849_16780 [Bacteroidota bacterium]